MHFLLRRLVLTQLAQAQQWREEKAGWRKTRMQSLSCASPPRGVGAAEGVEWRICRVHRCASPWARARALRKRRSGARPNCKVRRCALGLSLGAGPGSEEKAERRKAHVQSGSAE